MIQEIAVLTPLYVTIFWALVFLNSARRKNRAKYFLGFFMAVCFSLYLGHSLFFLGRFDDYLHYDPLYITASLLVYPMYYHYIRLLTKDDAFTLSYLRHYIPALFFLLSGYMVHIGVHDTAHSDIEGYFRTSYRFPDPKGAYFISQVYYFLHRLVFATQVFLYFTLGYKLIRNHRERILHFYSNQEDRNIIWVTVIFVSLILTALMSFSFNIIGKFQFYNSETALLLPSLIFSSLIFVLGFLANGQDQLVREISLADHSEQGREHKQGAPEDIRNKLETLLLREKVYLNPDLNIWDISARIGTNRTYLSGYINRSYGQNFSMYINRFRVEEAKMMLQNPDWDKYSLETIGEKCGFGSHNNFIRVFREFENQTPGRFRENCRTQGAIKNGSA